MVFNGLISPHLDQDYVTEAAPPPPQPQPLPRHPQLSPGARGKPCPSGTPTDTSWPWGLNLYPHPPLLLLPGERRGAGERLSRPTPLRGHSDPKRNGAFFPTEGGL